MFLQAPAYYDQINTINASKSPSTVHVKNTELSAFFRRYLMERAMSVYKWTLPNGWPLDYILYTLYCIGFFAVVRTDKFGVIPQMCTLSGYDVFYRPTTAIIANPLIDKTLTPEIGKTCALVKLKPNYTPILDLVSYYGDLLALCAESAEMNLINSHLSYVFAAGNKAQAEGFKKIFDRVASGEPCVVYGNNMTGADGKPNWTTFSQDLKQNYIADEVLMDMVKIRNMFDTEIGIPNANTEKRERMLADEVNANNIETFSATSLWLESLKKGCEDVNNMFGRWLDKPVSVDWRFGGDELAIVSNGDVRRESTPV